MGLKKQIAGKTAEKRQPGMRAEGRAYSSVSEILQAERDRGPDSLIGAKVELTGYVKGFEMLKDIFSFSQKDNNGGHSMQCRLSKTGLEKYFSGEPDGVRDILENSRRQICIKGSMGLQLGLGATFYAIIEVDEFEWASRLPDRRHYG